MRPPPSAASRGTTARPDRPASPRRSGRGGGDEPPPARPAWVEIDLDALGHNLRVLRSRLAGGTRVLAVVKADAYGHGAVPVARALEREGVDWLGVALVEEGAELRRALVGLPILVLGTIQPDELGEVRAHSLTPAVSSLDQLEMWARSAAQRPEQRPQSLHLKVDTGMHRLGLPSSDWQAAIEVLRRSPGLRLDGLLSHLAESEVDESALTAAQERSLAQALELVRRSLPAPESGLLVHLANSAAALHLPRSHHSLVRAGLALYGLDPARRARDLRGAMTVRARVVQVREIAAGERVGYGGSWSAARPSRIGVVPLGYADGYPWRLGGRARAVVGGVTVPVVGAISMDMVTLDLTGTDAGVGSTVTLLAGAPEDGPTAAELAELAGTVPYEVLCHFGLRLPKRYLGACGAPTAAAGSSYTE